MLCRKYGAQAAYTLMLHSRIFTELSPMDILCPLDINLNDQISALLKPPSHSQVQEYFDELVATRQCHGLKIKQDREFGKGVYAESEFGEGDLVLKDPILVGARHSSNKVDCLVCSYCFRFIGSIELQIGRKLYLQDLGLSVSSKLGSDSSDEEHEHHFTGHHDLGACSSSDSKEKIPLPKQVIESLMNGDVELPYSKKFSFPSAIPCSGGCGEAFYCSKPCAKVDWDSYHSLLCAGKKSESLLREVALLSFIQHANGTNDIFILVAKVISFTILRYKKLKAAHHAECEKLNGLNGFGSSDFSLLLEAWKPISMGYKRRFHLFPDLPDQLGRERCLNGRLKIVKCECLNYWLP